MKKNYLFLIIVFLSTQAFAQLATWELSGLSGVTAGLVSTSNVAPGVASAYLSRGSGITASSAIGAYSSYGWSTTASIGTTDYYQILITLSPSSQPLTSFGTLMVYATTSAPGPDFAVIRSSQNGFLTDIGSPVDIDASSGFVSFDLSSLSPVPAGGTITLRIYGYGANNANSGATFDIGDGSPGAGADIIFNATLPISLTSFTAVADAQAVNLRWVTASETDNESFVVERSADGISFEEIGWEKGAGTSTRETYYGLTDNQPLMGKNYYRLRQTDYDGQKSYGPVVIALFARPGNLTLAPSPASDLVRIQIDEPSEEDGLWQVFDMAGRLVQSGTWQSESAVTSIHVGTLTDGIYTFRLAMGQEVLVKQFRKE